MSLHNAAFQVHTSAKSINTVHLYSNLMYGLTIESKKYYFSFGEPIWKFKPFVMLTS